MEEEEVKENSEVKNWLEGYTLSIQGILKDEKNKDKFTEEERTDATAVITETLKWLEGNHSATKDEYTAKRTEVETACKSIMSKTMPQGMAQGMPMPTAPSSGHNPTIDEVD